MSDIKIIPSESNEPRDPFVDAGLLEVIPPLVVGLLGRDD